MAILLPLVPHGSARAVQGAPGLCSTQFVAVATQGELDAFLQSLLDASNQGGFTLDADAGAVIFGDGERGRVPDTRPKTTSPGSPALRYQDRAITPNQAVSVSSGSPHAPVARIRAEGCP